MQADKHNRKRRKRIPLARNHNFAALFCWKLRQGLKMNIDLNRIRAFINNFWVTQLKKHFQGEEQLLFNQTEDSLCHQAIKQHRDIAALIEYINTYGHNDKGAYTSLEILLALHISFEEKQLFPYLKSVLPAEILLTAGSHISHMHDNGTTDLYPDKFWIK
jgi:hemerythrin-like domain-containing protein